MPMTATATAVLDRVSGGRGEKLLRYSAISVISVAINQAFLILFFAVVGIDEIVSNVMAASIAAVPSFMLNKRWTWRRTSKAHWRREVLPFWVFSIAGLLLSTLLVALVAATTEEPVLIPLASISGYALLWVSKFLFLDQVMFGEQLPELSESE